MKRGIFNKVDSAYILIWSKKIKAIDLLGGKCIKCGNDNIFALDFHHNDGADKDFSFGDIKGLRWSVIAKEIKKCVLLCKNCHQQYHYPETNLYKKKLLEAKNVKGCLRCGYDQCLTSLDFHHRDRSIKSFTIGYVCRNHGFMVSLEKMIEEIEKCDVICRNCHAIDQINVAKFNEFRVKIYDKIETYKEQQKNVDKNLVIGFLNEGLRPCDIAKKIGCARSTISLLLKRNNIAVDSRGV